jgi:hypothetical protein
MSKPQFSPTAVIDIVSFGYRRLFKNLWPVTKLSLPFVLFSGLTGGFFYSDLLQLQKLDANTTPTIDDLISLGLVYGVFLLGTVVMFYALYAILRYVKDLHHDEVDSNLYNYIFPEGRLWGLLGISLLYGVAAIPLGILMILGFIMLILPGLAVLVGIIYLATRLTMSWVAYMERPEMGMFDAFAQSWRLTADNFWRTLAISFVVAVVSTIINTPFSVLGSISGMVAQLNPSFVSNPVFPVMSSVILAISNWAQYVIGMGGMVFVYFRFYYDLESRQRPSGGAWHVVENS